MLTRRNFSQVIVTAVLLVLATAGNLHSQYVSFECVDNRSGEVEIDQVFYLTGYWEGSTDPFCVDLWLASDTAGEYQASIILFGKRDNPNGSRVTADVQDFSLSSGSLANPTRVRFEFPLPYVRYREVIYFALEKLKGPGTLYYSTNSSCEQVQGEGNDPPQIRLWSGSPPPGIPTPEELHVGSLDFTEVYFDCADATKPPLKAGDPHGLVWRATKVVGGFRISVV